MSCTVYGRPQGKGRPRYTVRGGHAVAYTPESTRAYEARIKAAWQEQDGRNYGSCALALIVTAYYPAPSKARKAEREAMLRSRRSETPTFASASSIRPGISSRGTPKFSSPYSSSSSTSGEMI